MPRWATHAVTSRRHRTDPTRPGASQAILRTLQDDLEARAIAFRLLLFPFRPALEDARPERAGPLKVGRRVADLCRALGIPVLDATPFLQEAVARDGASAWFLGGPGSMDPHLSPAGHAGFARWLWESIKTSPLP